MNAGRRGRGRPKTIEIAEAAYNILEEIEPASVRAVCYRLFTEGLIDSMSKANTNKISRLLTEEREGEISRGSGSSMRLARPRQS
jgi:hypothetical protein